MAVLANKQRKLRKRKYIAATLRRMHHGVARAGVAEIYLRGVRRKICPRGEPETR